MDTPICDFVRAYAQKNALRLHMPGHKGAGPLGVENLDITEIHGADSLYQADGIIQKSEQNASTLFGCQTLYSTEGSSLCIRAMLYLALLWGKQRGRKPLVYAARNAHKTFMSAAALLDLEVEWLYDRENASYLCCRLDAEDLDARLQSARERPFALYVTSPDYLGNVADVAALARVCRSHDVLLLVDNAHGAYLRFLPESRHPADLGAHLCCDSAHKTLPVLTGGAYLHISADFPAQFSQQAKNALALFGSTSPSYLILQSLDAANRVLSGNYRQELAEFARACDALCARLRAFGFALLGDEPLKLTIDTRQWGYTGEEIDEILAREGIISEFADPDFLVLMLAPENSPSGLARLESALCAIPRKKALAGALEPFHSVQRAMSIREATLSPGELVPVEESAGRVLFSASVGCPPAVPIVICGERIDEGAIASFRRYGITHVSVVKEP